MLSFVSHVKICSGYEDYKDRAIYYIKHIDFFCKKYNIEYDITVIEHVDEKNSFLLYKNIKSIVSDSINVNIIPISVESYPNKFDFNMNEFNGINLGIIHSKYKFIIINNIDIIYDEEFFKFSKTLVPATLYRITTYEINNINTDSDSFMEHKLLFKKNICHCCFPISKSKSPSQIGIKSGDIMVLDRDSWLKVNGVPYGDYRFHTDFSIILVLMNNFSVIIPDKKICIYTKKQNSRNSKVIDDDKKIEIHLPYDDPIKKTLHLNKYINSGHDGKLLFDRFDIKMRDDKLYVNVDYGKYTLFLQWINALSYRNKLICNEQTIDEIVKDFKILN